MKKLRITVGQKTYEVTVEVISDETPQLPHSAPQDQYHGPVYVAASPAPVAASQSSTTTGALAVGVVTSPMAGVVKSIEVNEGDSVEEGQALLVLEAMKMDNQVTASMAGKVKRLDVAKGESVAEGQVLLVIE